VTIPLEIGLSGLPNAVRMFSHTQFGLSYIILTFNDNANDYFARQQPLERLQGVDLPDACLLISRRSRPQSARSTAIGSRAGAGRRQSSAAFRTGWSAAISGRFQASRTVRFGGLIKQYEVTVNTARMKSHNVSLRRSSPRSAAAMPTPAAAFSSRAISST
jgi:heavy metal efflux system protein